MLDLQSELALGMALRVQNLNYQISGKQILQNLNFMLPSTGLTVLLGPNGAGKSVLLRLCQGLLTTTTGQIFWDDQSPQSCRRALGFVLQKPVLLRRSVESNLRHALQINGVPFVDQQQHIEKALEFAKLSRRARDGARRLSGGEQQRLALARAWMLRPRNLLLDEPANHLDPGATAHLEEQLKRIRATGVGLWLATHDLQQARRLADRVMFLHHGELLEITDARTFFIQPVSIAAQAFLRGQLLDYV